MTVAVTADAEPSTRRAPVAAREAQPRVRRDIGGNAGDGADQPALSPQPPTGRPYSAVMPAPAGRRAYGVQTVCVWIEEQGDNRVFATSQAFTVNVLRKRVKR